MNYAKTAILLAAMTGLFLMAGYLLGGVGGAAIAFVIALAMNGYAYWNSDKMALRMHNAEPVTRSGAPELYDMVERLAQNADMPTPAIYIIHSEQSERLRHWPQSGKRGRRRNHGHHEAAVDGRAGRRHGA